MPGSTDKQTPSTQAHTLLLATDSKNSIIAELSDDRTNSIAYSVYGHQTGIQKSATHLGFNGELREMRIGWYLLGNGYRAYNPVLMRFHSPDSWSPFGAGGWNAYMYCDGEPVMGLDPTGHFNPSKWPRNVKRIFKARQYQRVEESPPHPLSATFQQASDRVNGTAPANAPSSSVSPQVHRNRERGLPDGYEDYKPPSPRRDLKKKSTQPSFFQNAASNAYGMDGRSSTPAPVQTFSSTGTSGRRPAIQAASSTYVVPVPAPRSQAGGSIRVYRVQRTEDGTVTQSSYEKTDLGALQAQIRRDPPAPGG